MGIIIIYRMENCDNNSFDVYEHDYCYHDGLDYSKSENTGRKKYKKKMEEKNNIISDLNIKMIDYEKWNSKLKENLNTVLNEIDERDNKIKKLEKSNTKLQRSLDVMYLEVEERDKAIHELDSDIYYYQNQNKINSDQIEKLLNNLDKNQRQINEFNNIKNENCNDKECIGKLKSEIEKIGRQLAESYENNYNKDEVIDMQSETIRSLTEKNNNLKAEQENVEKTIINNNRKLWALESINQGEIIEMQKKTIHTLYD